MISCGNVSYGKKGVRFILESQHSFYGSGRTDLKGIRKNLNQQFFLNALPCHWYPLNMLFFQEKLKN
ncbi:hypothetical protein KKC22_20605, partial [Myxococcota bacterium]|nr:hypothetical protein [Myxococcota bacterium]